MKRHLTTAIIVGLVVGGLIIGLHLAGWLSGLEQAVADIISRWGDTTKQVPALWHFVIVFVLAIGVALVTLATERRARMSGIVGILLVELLGVAWICSLFQTFFQPLLPMLAALLGFGAPIAYLWLQEKIAAYLEERRSRPPKIKPAPIARAAPIALVPAVATPERVVAEKVPERVVEKPVEKPRARARRGDTSADAAQVVEVTAVVCDLANKHDIAEECEPAMFADITERFIAHVTQALRAEGAYIESAGGEGVVAIFGYPESDKQHAEKATRKAMALTQSFSESNKSSKVDALRNAGLHAGVSSGTMIMAPVKNNGQRNLLATGEPVELARRFCIANRFYGSRVLLGPRTFELASKILVARPIDFLSGVDVRERHEIYEPVALALNASREIITRRDAFWNGVVLYREKRWAEAYSQFQNARGPEGEEDRPLQLYLRRLEPLALQLTNTPLDE